MPSRIWDHDPQQAAIGIQSGGLGNAVDSQRTGGEPRAACGLIQEQNAACVGVDIDSQPPGCPRSIHLAGACRDHPDRQHPHRRQTAGVFATNQHSKEFLGHEHRGVIRRFGRCAILAAVGRHDEDLERSLLNVRGGLGGGTLDSDPGSVIGSSDRCRCQIHGDEKERQGHQSRGLIQPTTVPSSAAPIRRPSHRGQGQRSQRRPPGRPCDAVERRRDPEGRHARQQAYESSPPQAPPRQPQSTAASRESDGDGGRGQDTGMHHHHAGITGGHDERFAKARHQRSSWVLRLC